MSPYEQRLREQRGKQVAPVARVRPEWKIGDLDAEMAKRLLTTFAILGSYEQEQPHD